jgi:hydroxyacylglutathione hydrolase
MFIEQIYTGCLAQGAYFISSGSDCVIIDPLRDIEPYIERTEKEALNIKYIFETHFHADFVSGHQELSQRTGAPIVFGPKANPLYNAIIATDNQIFSFGDVKIKVLHTPGHTLESTCYLLYDKNSEPHALFSGDTLFIGDVGRPDLAQKSDLKVEDLAGMLYDSLREKIMVLPDRLWVYPAHGAGSACGKNMSKETYDTLGNQKMFNYALRSDMRKEEFVKEVCSGLEAVPAPYYFEKNVMLNKTGVAALSELINKAKALSPEEIEFLANHANALILDCRNAADFASSYIPKSINIGIKGDFAPWVGTLIKDIHQEIILIAEPDKVEEAITRLSRVGYDQVLGFLEGGFESWEKAGKDTSSIPSVSAKDFVEKLQKDREINIIDVRKPSEYETAHIPRAQNVPLAEINEHMATFKPNNEYFIHCAGGYRSMIGASILAARGIEVVDVQGGYGAIKIFLN